MNIQKITSLVLSALIIAPQISFESKAMKSANTSDFIRTYSKKFSNPTTKYVLDMIANMRDAYHDPNFLSKPYTETQYLSIEELRVKTLAHDLLTILDENKSRLYIMDVKQRIEFDAKVYSVVNRFLQIIDSLDLEAETPWHKPRTKPLPELPEYLSEITPNFLRSDEGILLLSTIKFGDKYDTESDIKIPITPHLQSLLLSFHFTKLFIEESFGKFLEKDIKLDDFMSASINQGDKPLDVCHQLSFCCSNLLSRKLRISGDPSATPIYWTQDHLRHLFCAQSIPATDCVSDSLQPDTFKNVTEIKDYVKKLAEDARTLLYSCNFGFLPSFEKKSSFSETYKYMKENCSELGKFQINQFRKSWFAIITKLKYAIMCADTLEYGTLTPSNFSDAIVCKKLKYFKEDKEYYDRESARIHNNGNLMMLFLCTAFGDILPPEDSPFNISKDDLPELIDGNISKSVIYIFSNFICNKHRKNCKVCKEEDLAEFSYLFSNLLNTESSPAGNSPSDDNYFVLTMLSYLKHYGECPSEEQ